MSAKVVPIGLRRQINDQLRAALEGMPVAVSWASIEDGRVLFANRKHLETFGHGISDTPTISDFLNRVVVDKQWAKIAAEGLQAIVAQHPTTRLELPGAEQDVLCKDGSRKTILFSSAVIPEAGWIITTCLDVTDRRAREQLSHRLATLDPLTGLLNRRSFEERLAAAISGSVSDVTHCILAMDLDGFKSINDVLGHSAGDETLKLIAGRISAALRTDDAIARWGGDEFLALLLDVRTPQELHDIVGRIVATVERPLRVEAHPISVGVSIGWARFPEDGTDMRSLLNVADARMYQNKRQSRRAAGSVALQ